MGPTFFKCFLLVIINESLDKSSIAWWQIKCTSPTSYSVKPTIGFVEPGQRFIVSVFLLRGDYYMLSPLYAYRC